MLRKLISIRNCRRQQSVTEIDYLILLHENNKVIATNHAQRPGKAALSSIILLARNYERALMYKRVDIRYVLMPWHNRLDVMA